MRTYLSEGERKHVKTQVYTHTYTVGNQSAFHRRGRRDISNSYGKTLSLSSVVSTVKCKISLRK